MRQAIFEVPTSSATKVAERRGDSGFIRGGTMGEIMLLTTTL
jgi:hypothetical protein